MPSDRLRSIKLIHGRVYWESAGSRTQPTPTRQGRKWTRAQRAAASVKAKEWAAANPPPTQEERDAECLAYMARVKRDREAQTVLQEMHVWRMTRVWDVWTLLARW